eukprot:3520340-Amphidinium_carterae.2
MHQGLPRSSRLTQNFGNHENRIASHNTERSIGFARSHTIDTLFLSSLTKTLTTGRKRLTKVGLILLLLPKMDVRSLCGKVSRHT